MRALHAYVSGLVQGVFFRATTRERAEALGLEGWVRNTPDGRVEVWVQGPDERVGEMERWLHRGPPRARVRGVEVEETEPDASVQGFQVRY